jgi:hypothetical protein
MELRARGRQQSLQTDRTLHWLLLILLSCAPGCLSIPYTALTYVGCLAAGSPRWDGAQAVGFYMDWERFYQLSSAHTCVLLLPVVCLKSVDLQALAGPPRSQGMCC